jgi:hypothetical protein
VNTAHRRFVLLSCWILLLAALIPYLDVRALDPGSAVPLAGALLSAARQATPGLETPTPTPTPIPPQRTPANMPIVFPAIVIVAIIVGAWLILSMRRQRHP